MVTRPGLDGDAESIPTLWRPLSQICRLARLPGRMGFNLQGDPPNNEGFIMERGLYIYIYIYYKWRGV